MITVLPWCDFQDPTIDRLFGAENNSTEPLLLMSKVGDTCRDILDFIQSISSSIIFLNLHIFISVYRADCSSFVLVQLFQTFFFFFLLIMALIVFPGNFFKCIYIIHYLICAGQPLYISFVFFGFHLGDCMSETSFIPQENTQRQQLGSVDCM